jgi:hypothetical protein
MVALAPGASDAIVQSSVDPAMVGSCRLAEPVT